MDCKEEELQALYTWVRPRRAAGAALLSFLLEKQGEAGPDPRPGAARSTAYRCRGQSAASRATLRTEVRRLLLRGARRAWQQGSLDRPLRAQC